MTPPRRRTRRLLKIFLTLWLFLMVLAAAGGAAYGRYVAAPGQPDLAGTWAGDALARYGEPQAFWLVDGPAKPGSDDVVRWEQWLYPDDGVMLTFSNGYLVGEEEVTFTVEVPSSPLSPTALHRGLSRDEVESVVNEPGRRVKNVKTPYAGLVVVAYPESRVLVGYLDGRFFSAQVY